MVTALSELVGVQQHLQVSNTASKGLLESPFWQDVFECWERKSETLVRQMDIRHLGWNEIRRWTGERFARYTAHNQILFECIATVSGSGIIVDASKDWKRLYLLQKSKAFDIKVIHLIRDGRAVVNSYMRKYGLFRVGLRRWAAPAIAAFYLRRLINQSDWCQIRYEALATCPEQVLVQICKFLELHYEPGMIRYRSHPYFGVGGNRMLLREDETIALDERWKQELPRWQRIKLSTIGGWLNRLYGY